MDYNVRYASIEDAKELSLLKQRVWDETYRGIYKDELIDNFDYTMSRKKFVKMIENPDLNLYVVESKGELVGYMSIGAPHHPYLDYEQELGLLYIRKDYQKCGIGRDLFELAKRDVLKNGYNRFIVSCNKYNDGARKFYEKMGGKLILLDDDAQDKRYPQAKYLCEIK